MKLELVSLDREAQVRFELPALLRALVEAFLEEGERAAARFLGAIQCEIRVAQQRFAFAAILRSDRDPDARRGNAAHCRR